MICLSISGSSIGTTVTTVRAYDTDANAVINYEIISADPSYLQVNAQIIVFLTENYILHSALKILLYCLNTANKSDTAQGSHITVHKGKDDCTL